MSEVGAIPQIQGYANLDVRVSFTDGIPPLSVPDNYDHEYCRSQALSALTPSIGFQKTLNQIQTDAILETQRFALSKKPEQRAAALNPILETVTSQLSQLTASVTCELGKASSPGPRFIALTFDRWAVPHLWTATDPDILPLCSICFYRRLKSGQNV